MVAWDEDVGAFEAVHRLLDGLPTRPSGELGLERSASKKRSQTEE
jgi:hypothetical protein